MMHQTISIIVKGKVQGVFFRQSTREKATMLGITGTVANKPDGSVYIVATGTREQLDALAVWSKTGPPGAVVAGTEIKEESMKRFPDFRIVR